MFLKGRTTWHPTRGLGNRPGQQPAHSRKIYYYFLFPLQEKKKKSSSLYFDILRRLTGVMPHQISWRYDMLTLMFNKVHLLQNLEAGHIPSSCFYYYYFFLSLPTLVFSRKETLSFIPENEADVGTLCIFSYLSSPMWLINHTWAHNYFSTFLWRVIQSILASDANIKGILRKTH